MEAIAKNMELKKRIKTIKLKRNLDNTELKKHFGKGDFTIWDKDIYSGDSTTDF